MELAEEMCKFIFVCRGSRRQSIPGPRVHGPLSKEVELVKAGDIGKLEARVGQPGWPPGVIPAETLKRLAATFSAQIHNTKEPTTGSYILRTYCALFAMTHDKGRTSPSSQVMLIAQGVVGCLPSNFWFAPGDYARPSMIARSRIDGASGTCLTRPYQG